MSETLTNQEQPETPVTTGQENNTAEEANTTLGGQTIERNEDGTTTHEVFPVTSSPTEQPAGSPVEEDNTVTIGGQTKAKNEDGTTTHEVFPITTYPADSTPESVVKQPTPETSKVVPENAPITAEKTSETSVTVAPTKEYETETIAEVGVAKEASNQAEFNPVKPGLFGSLAIGAAAFAARLSRRRRQK